MTAALVALALAASPLDAARAAYQAGELARARAELEGLLYPLRLDSEESERDAQLLLAATYFAQDDAGRAGEEAARGLGVFGTASVDPLLFPPDFVVFVENVREAHKARIAALAAERRARRAPRDLLAPSPPGPTEVGPSGVPPQRPSMAWQFVPFGVGQFKNGEPTKGTILAVSQGACVAVSGASLGVALALRGADGKYNAADAQVARPLNVAYLVGAYAFAALYAYAVIDGLVRRR